MKYNGIVISDIHFGVIDPNISIFELNETFINYINKLKKIDFIIIAGDYFDHKLYLNDKSSEIALLFMDKLIDIIKKHNCPLRIIYGTEAHEVNQYNMFKLYEDDINLNFKIIKTVTKEELLPNLKVLYVPEEYMLDKNEYYKDYFNDKYNYVFGHGTIQELVGFNTKNIVKKEKVRKKVPVFTSTELENICDGQVYFGHYHINTNIKNKIFYIGSYSRWRFGEEEPKGFYHITYDINKNKYDQVFIENQLAKTYITYTFGYDSKVINSENDIIEELTKLDKLNEFKKYDYIRYIFNIPINYPNPEFIINLLTERYKFNDNIKVKIINGYIEKKKKINKEKMDSIVDDYSIIFDKNIKLENKIEFFIKRKWDKNISVDTIKKYLYE